MATTESVKQQVATRQSNGGGNAPARVSHGHTLLDTLEGMRPQIARALPSMVEPDRFIRVALTTLRRTPKLLQCTPESVLGGLMTSAQLGLEPGPLGHAYLVPFYNGKTKQHEAQWIIGYTGIIDLARRSGSIETMIARAVYEEDLFDVEYGLNERLEHKPNLVTDDRGPLLYTYAIAKYVGGGHNFVVLGRGDIEKAKQQSQTGRANKGPWVDHFEPMALKTAVRRLRPFLPLSVEMRDAFASDEQTRLYTGDEGDVIDVAPEPDPAIEAGAVEDEPDGETAGEQTQGGDGS